MNSLSAGPGPLIFKLLLVVLAISGCEEDPGCLDVLANNYAVDAEDPCTDCCSYPELRLSLRHRWIIGDSVRNFPADSSVYKIGNDVVRFERIRFFLSNLQFVRKNGEVLDLLDRLTLSVQFAGDTIQEDITDNFTLAEAGSFRTYVPGTYRGSGAFDKLRFTLGVPSPVADQSPDQFPAGHPLADEGTNMYTAQNGFAHTRIAYALPAADTLIQVLRTGGEQQLVQVELPIALQIDPGFHSEIVLAVDYQKWFADLDLAEGEPQEVSAQIVSNQAESFSVVSVLTTLN